MTPRPTRYTLARRLIILVLIIPWSVVFLGLSVFYKATGK